MEVMYFSQEKGQKTKEKSVILNMLRKKIDILSIKIGHRKDVYKFSRFP